jgi:hypothetical protein
MFRKIAQGLHAVTTWQYGRDREGTDSGSDVDGIHRNSAMLTQHDAGVFLVVDQNPSWGK